ncbi:MAG: PIN domain-containing protein [Actinobacteria bacterium]|nr:PIN domain-containing protein [Actinomycetota bacterium]
MEYLVLEGEIIVDFLRGIAEAKGILERAAEEGTICVSAWTCAKVISFTNGQDYEPACELLGSFKVIPVSWEVARNAGKWFIDDSAGQLDLGDLIVAATVCELGAVLVTKGKIKYPPGDYQVRVEKYGV